MTSGQTSHPRRRWWFFSLKDRLPLPPDGWSVVVHQPECGTPDGGLECMAGAPCFARRVRFVGIPTIDQSFEVGMSDITAAIDIVNGRSPSGILELSEGMPDHRWVIVVSVVEPEDEFIPFEDAFSIVIDAVIALRNATGVSIPDPSVERVQPMYMIGVQEEDGEIAPGNVVIVEHALPGPPPPADQDTLRQAQKFLFERWRGHPAEQYRTFATKASTSVHQDGNYEAAILNAAIACELLVKTTSWMLTYEASLLAGDPAPDAHTKELGEMKPRQLIGRVLQPRLGGNWDSTQEGRPVREWRVGVAQKRNQLLHLAGGITSGDARQAVDAMDSFASHLMERVASNGAKYPRTAMTLVGPSALEGRNCLKVVQRALATLKDPPDDWLPGYRSFVDTLIGD